MKHIIKILFLLIAISAFSAAKSQNLNTQQICQLNSELSETSGLIKINGNFWTHNDSGNEAALYMIDTSNGNIAHSLFIKNGQNIDWEDITIDSDYVFIGDFGNNNGDRTDLNILKIPKDSLIVMADSVNADKIEFYYPNQTISKGNTTNFDCEAMIASGDSLYLFSKNWGNEKTNLYSLPKTPGNYPANLIDTYDISCLVTAASIDTTNNRIALLSYSSNLSAVYVHILENYNTYNFLNGNINQYNAGMMFHQAEGIILEDEIVYFSNEKFQTINAKLNKAIIDDLTNSEKIKKEKECEFYPNPFINNLTLLNCSEYKSLRITNISGRIIISRKITKDTIRLNTSFIEKGSYILELSNESQSEIHLLIKG